jgi:hypothetical protein
MSNTQQTAQKAQLDPKDASFRLQAYFKPGGKLTSYKYNANWLLNYYRTMAGPQNLQYSIDAVYRKMEEIIHRSTRLIVYDNRPGTQYPVMMEIVNGKLITDNRPEAEKIRKPLKFY